MKDEINMETRRTMAAMYAGGASLAAVGRRFGLAPLSVRKQIAGLTAIRPVTHLKERHSKRIKVYRITFPDGFAYVGQTRMRVCHRVWLHRSGNKYAMRKNNPELYARLMSMPYEVETLSRHNSKSCADNAEIAAIRAQPKTLNKTYIFTERQETPPPVPRPKNDRVKKRSTRYQYDRRDGREYRCRCCGQIKPSHMYHTDRSRSCGIASKCRSCANELRKRLRNRGEVAADVIYTAFMAEKRRA